MAEHLETRFLTTPWTLIVGADESASDRATQALVKLCENYRYPVFAFIRARQHNVDDAKDLTQGFFEFLLEKKVYRHASRERGKFRSFLLATLKNYMANEFRFASRQKRGGHQVHLSIDDMDSDSGAAHEIASEASPESLYDREWARTVFDEVWAKLEAEFEMAGMSDRFKALRSSLMMSEGAVPYVALAEQLNLSEAGVKTAAFRMRRRFRELFRETVAKLVENPNQIDEEIAYLISVMASDH